MDELIPELQRVFRIQGHQARLPLTGKLSDLQGVPVVKFKDNPWCVVYWEIGRAPLLREDCRTLSGKLKTKVMHLTEQDTSKWVEWFCYENQNDVEFAEWMIYDDSVYFESSLRRQPHLKKISPTEIRSALDQSIDELLAEQAIYLPGLDLNLADPQVERVDLLTLPEFPLGMKEFRDWMDLGHPEYAIFAIKAPIELVGPILMDQFEVKEWQKQSQSPKRIYEALPYDDKAYWIPMLQPTSNPWTVVYWIVDEWENLEKICEHCSATLQTSAIALEEEDTSGAFGYQIYDQGKKIEDAGYCDEFRFESDIREEPEFDNFDDSEWEVIRQFIHETFVQEGIYVPPLSMMANDPCFERVDFLRRY